MSRLDLVDQIRMSKRPKKQSHERQRKQKAWMFQWLQTEFYNVCFKEKLQHTCLHSRLHHRDFEKEAFEWPRSSFQKLQTWRVHFNRRLRSLQRIARPANLGALERLQLFESRLLKRWQLAGLVNRLWRTKKNIQAREQEVSRNRWWIPPPQYFLLLSPPSLRSFSLALCVSILTYNNRCWAVKYV